MHVHARATAQRPGFFMPEREFHIQPVRHRHDAGLCHPVAALQHVPFHTRQVDGAALAGVGRTGAAVLGVQRAHAQPVGADGHLHQHITHLHLTAMDGTSHHGTHAIESEGAVDGEAETIGALSGRGIRRCSVFHLHGVHFHRVCFGGLRFGVLLFNRLHICRRRHNEPPVREAHPWGEGENPGHGRSTIGHAPRLRHQPVAQLIDPRASHGRDRHDACVRQRRGRQQCLDVGRYLGHASGINPVGLGQRHDATPHAQQ